MIRPSDASVRAATVVFGIFAAILLLWFGVMVFVVLQQAHTVVQTPQKISVVDVASGGIAVCAFIITVYSTWATRRHNRLSVRPILSLDMSISPNQPRFHVSVRNAGPGVTIFESWQLVLVDSPSLDTNSLSSRQLTDKVSYRPLIDFTRYYPDDAIQSGETAEFIGTKPMSADETECRAFYDVLKKVRIYYTYSSIYGERWEGAFTGP